MDYEKLLEKALKAVPKKAGEGERFEPPRAEIEKAGRRTIILNIMDIASRLRRDPNHLIKFLLKELATKGEISGQRLYLLGVFPTDTINKKIDSYLKEFVYCGECGKPDTKLLKEDKFWIIKCEACGARHTL